MWWCPCPEENNKQILETEFLLLKQRQKKMHYIKKLTNYKLLTKSFNKASLEVWTKAQESY